MPTDTLTNPLEAAERCLELAENEKEQARMARFTEIAHAWMEIHRLRSASQVSA